MNDTYSKKTICDFPNIIVWGAGILGRQTLDIGLPISCVWDIRFEEIRSVYGVSVERPLSGNFNKDDTLIIICVGDEQAQAEIFSTLHTNNCKNIMVYKDVEDYIISVKINEFRQMNRDIEQSGIVFIGDSMIELFCLSDYFPSLKMYNRGIGGDTVTGLLKHLDESVFSLSPSKVFVCIGTNDLAKQVQPKLIAEQICELVRKIIERLPTVGIFVISLLPVYSGNAPHVDKRVVLPRTNKLIRELNMLIASGTSRLGAVYIDVHSQITDRSEQLDIDLTLDGLHLNPKGYTVFSQILKAYL